jgi:CRAL/TRIO domain
MSHICPICDLYPSSHSFIHLSHDDGVHIFYSCPSLAKRYYDMDGILSHFDNTLHHYQAETAAWRWIFDADGFDFAHALELRTAIGLAKLITEKYSANLKAIHIVNSNWYIRIILNLVLPFLSERVQGIVKIISTDSTTKPTTSGSYLFADDEDFSYRKTIDHVD